MTTAPALPRDAIEDPGFVPAAKLHHVKALTFTGRVSFRNTLNARVDEFVKANGIKTRDIPSMYAKCAIVIVWWVASLVLLVYTGLANWHALSALALAASFGAATVAIGFNVMHDACHGALSKRPLVNRILGYSGEAIGLSNFVWRQQHNVWHHTYPNIAGLDEALEADGWLRSSPKDVWRPLHRYQHLYAVFLYALSSVGLMLVRNFNVFFTGRSSAQFVYPKMGAGERIVFLVGRAFNITVFIVVPALVFEWWLAILVFLTVAVTSGTIMAHIFMIAHISKDLDFAEPVGNPLHIEDEWAVHQVKSTMNFSAKSRVIGWFVGGLNFQIEHHLFPHMCHLVYPKIAPLVEETCRDFGLPYHYNPGLLSALRGHYRSLKLFGQPPVVAGTETN